MVAAHLLKMNLSLHNASLVRQHLALSNGRHKILRSANLALEASKDLGFSEHWRNANRVDRYGVSEADGRHDEIRDDDGVVGSVVEM